MNKLIIYLKNFDWVLFGAVLLLVCFGLVEIYSIALGRGTICLISRNNYCSSVWESSSCFFSPFWILIT